MSSQDPTRTTTQRRNWAADYRGRWRDVRGAVREQLRAILGSQFRDAASKQTEFRRWFTDEVTSTVLDQMPPSEYRRGQHWTGGRVRDAYAAGLRRARQALKRAGVGAEAIRNATRPQARRHRNVRKRLYVDAYTDTEDVVNATVSDVTKTFRQALSQGKPVRAVISAVVTRVKKVGVTRSETVASTAPVNAANQAAVEAYEAAGIERVTTEPEADLEWQTSQDHKVCEECRGLAGREFSIAEVQDGTVPRPPQHPNCRCFLIPA